MDNKEKILKSIDSSRYDDFIALTHYLGIYKTSPV